MPAWTVSICMNVTPGSQQSSLWRTNTLLLLLSYITCVCLLKIYTELLC